MKSFDSTARIKSQKLKGIGPLDKRPFTEKNWFYNTKTIRAMYCFTGTVISKNEEMKSVSG